MSRKNSQSKQEQLLVGNQVISYTLTYANRKTVGITVRVDQSVELRVPRGSDPAAITEIVRKRAAWILRQQQKFAQLPPKQPPRRFTHGETHRFLGCPIQLKVEPWAGTKPVREQVKLEQSMLCVWVKNPQEQKRVQTLVERWYRKQAEIIFARRLHIYLPLFRQYSISMPDLTIRRMKARWGSCSTNGTITLNLKLIQVEERLIDYVIVHELCHLIEHNHSKRFYALLDRMLPDWRERRQCLNQAEIDG